MKWAITWRDPGSGFLRHAVIEARDLLAAAHHAFAHYKINAGDLIEISEYERWRAG